MTNLSNAYASGMDAINKCCLFSFYKILCHLYIYWSNYDFLKIWFFNLLLKVHLPAQFFFFLRHCLLCLFIYFWLCWVFVSLRGLSVVVASGGHSSSRCAGLSPSRPLPSRGTGSRRAGSVIVAQGPSCSAACGIFPDQGSNPCPLHWQADSQPLRHQGSHQLSFWQDN